MLATDINGIEVIFVINEALWFGQQMDHSLPSSNQVCEHDVHLWNNPCDPFRGLSIHNPSSDHPVPLNTDGIVAFTETRAPTDAEISRLPHVHITSSAKWKPQNATYNLQSIEFGVKYLSLAPLKTLLAGVSLFRVPPILAISMI